MGKYGTYLEFNGSHEAPKHRKTFGSITQFCARAHFRSPHILSATIFQHGFLSNSEIIFLFNFTREPQRSLTICWLPYFKTDFFQAVEPYFRVLFFGTGRVMRRGAMKAGGEVKGLAPECKAKGHWSKLN